MKEQLGPGEPVAVVTGVSSGIGAGVAGELVRAGWHVFGSVRRAGDAERLSRQLGPAYTPLVFDVTDAEAVARAAEQVAQALGGRKLDGLVNNAGVAVPGPLLQMPLAELRRQIEVNLVGALGVTQAFFPLLRTRADGEKRPARIVNISSIAGRFPFPFLGPYVASKHGMQGLSDCLRLECLPDGVDVVVIDPVSVATAIWDKAEGVDVARYTDARYGLPMERMKKLMIEAGRHGSRPEGIGRLVVKVLHARRPRARYLAGGQTALFWVLTHLPGRRLTDRIWAKLVGLPVQR